MCAQTPQARDRGKTKKDHACKLIERMSQNLIHFSICATMLLAGSGPNNISRRDGEPRPRRGGTQKHGLAEAKHPATQQGKGWLRTSRNIDSKYHETLFFRFHGFASSWSLLNQRTKRCCVCRDFTAACCNNKATKGTWLGRVSNTARVTLKITKHEIPLNL